MAYFQKGLAFISAITTMVAIIVMAAMATRINLVIRETWKKDNKILLFVN